MYRTKDSSKWDQRLSKSPFRMNLLAEEEKIHEEHFIREKEEAYLKRAIERKKEKAKADIIVKVIIKNRI